MDVPQLLLEIILNDPLYKKREYSKRIPRTYLASIKPINYYCEGECQSEQTFAIYEIDNQHFSNFKQDLVQLAHISMASRGGGKVEPHYVDEQIYQLTFRCAKCNDYKINFHLAFHHEQIAKSATHSETVKTVVQKVGQLPSAESAVGNEIKKWLNKQDLDLYKKGLRSEANGFGIGAFGYFRRIMENNIEKILDEVSKTSDSQELIDAIKEAKKEHTAANRLELVKEHAPASFEVAGQNVFKILYSALSVGLHAKSDEDCLTLATHIRVCLNYLIKKVSKLQKEEDEVKAAIKGLS